MEPIEELEMTLQSVRTLFQLFSHDIFKSNYRYGLRFYVIAAFYTFELICGASTALDQQRDPLLRVTVAGLTFGSLQVN